jgi:four helix bundle protein
LSIDNLAGDAFIDTSHNECRRSKETNEAVCFAGLKLVSALPTNVQGRAVGSQLVRAGTSVASNYRAACRGRSKAEFVAKLGIVVEEADESAFWLELIIEGTLLPAKLVQPLLDEANELTRIMVSSLVTARSKVRSRD